MAPKKGVKMSGAVFLADETMGKINWAEEMEDSYNLPMRPSSDRTGESHGSTRRDYGGASGGADGSSDRYAGYSKASDSDRPVRAAVPFPDKPPYTAHIGNLSFDATEGEISSFFASCDVTNVRLVRDREQDRPKGFGYVEFGTKEGLSGALELNGSHIAGRPVRVSVAEPPKDRGDDRTTGEWRRSGPPPSAEPTQRRSYERHGGERSERGDREEGGRRQNSFRESDGKVRDLNNWERKPLPVPATVSDRPRGDRESHLRSPAPSTDGGERPERTFRERPQIERQPSAAEKDNEWRKAARPDLPQHSTPASPVLPQSRPKLELKKRSELPILPGAPSPAGDGKASPFGGARPIDTTQREKEIEEKQAAATAARRAREEKEREEKRAAREAQEKASEAGTPVANKSFDNLRRGSGSVATAETAEEESKEKAREKPAAVERPQMERRRTDSKPATKTPASWRDRSTEKPKQEGDDGWMVAPGPRRPGRGSGRQ